MVAVTYIDDLNIFDIDCFAEIDVVFFGVRMEVSHEEGVLSAFAVVAAFAVVYQPVALVGGAGLAHLDVEVFAEFGGIF